MNDTTSDYPLSDDSQPSASAVVGASGVARRSSLDILNTLLTAGSILVIVLAIAAFILSRIPSNADIFLPAQAEQVNPKISIVGHPAQAHRGALYMTFINEEQDVNKLQELIARLNNDTTIVPRQDISSISITPQQQNSINRLEMLSSEETAEVVALQELGFTYPVHGVQVQGVFNFSAASTQLQIGDIVVSAEGQTIDSTNKLQRIVQSHKVGTSLQLVIKRNSQTLTVRVRTVGIPTAPKTPAIGIQIQPMFDLSAKAPYKISIDAGQIGGPSAGLAFTLGIINRLSGTDLTHGHKIAVTGTIDLGGTVGQIGGIKQKIIGARWAGAQYFLAPVENYAEAKPYAQGITLIPVHTLSDALAFLHTLK